MVSHTTSHIFKALIYSRHFKFSGMGVIRGLTRPLPVPGPLGVPGPYPIFPGTRLKTICNTGDILKREKRSICFSPWFDEGSRPTEMNILCWLPWESLRIVSKNRTSDVVRSMVTHGISLLYVSNYNDC